LTGVTIPVSVETIGIYNYVAEAESCPRNCMDKRNCADKNDPNALKAAYVQLNQC
jgi:hypothetical protein